MRVDIERIKAIEAELKVINDTPLKELEIYENGEQVVLPEKLIADWRFTGLCNTSLLEMFPIDMKDFDKQENRE
jgi:hypothetical protein